MSDSSEEEDNSLQEQQQQQQQQQQDAAVREHSYLPGTSNPLFPASLLEQRRRQEQEGLRKRRDYDGLQELAILELEDVVLFPGSTLPLRLRHSPWIEFLGPKIDDSRNHPNEEVRIGVVSHVRSVDRRQTSALRMAFTTGTGRGRQNNQGLLMVRVNDVMEDDDEDDEYEHADEEESSEDEASAEYHELMDEGDGQDGSGEHGEVEIDAPSEMDPEARSEEVDEEPVQQDIGDEGEQQHQRIEQQQAQVENQEGGEEAKEQQDVDMQQQEETNEDPASDAQPAFALRYDVNLVEENLDRIDRSLNDALEVMDGVLGHQIDHRHLLNISRRLDRAEVAQRPIVEAFDDILDLIRSGARLTDPDFVELLRVARRHRVRVSEQLDRMQSIHFRLRHMSGLSDSQSGDPLIGRIGTVATVSYTFDDTLDILDVGNNDALRNEARNELVVTVLGT